jgi:hypothetical protein
MGKDIHVPYGDNQKTNGPKEYENNAIRNSMQIRPDNCYAKTSSA